MNVTDIENLEEVLTTVSDEQRAQITHLWGMTGEKFAKFPDFVEAVLEFLELPVCARYVWEYLTPDERQILYHTMSYAARDGLRRTALQTKSQVPPERFEPALAHLIQLCLVYEQSEEMEKGQRGNSHHLSPTRGAKSRDIEVVPVVYPFSDYLDTLYKVGREIFTPTGDRSKKTLAEVLMSVDNEDLYDIYQNYSIKWGNYSTRNDFIMMIANTLMGLEEPLDFLHELDKKALDLYLWLRQQGGRATMQDVRTYTKLSDTKLSDALMLLESAALAFDTLTQQVRVLFIPLDVYANLKNVKQEKPEAEAAPGASDVAEDFVPAATSPGEPVILYDMAFAVNAIYQQTIEPTQVGRVPKRIATKIRAQLRGQVRSDFQYEDNYLEMLLDIGKENRLLRLSKSPLMDIKEHYEPGERLSWWSQLDTISQAASLLRYWKGSYRWEDLTGVHYRAWDPYYWQPVAGREVILKHLARRKPGRWYTVALLLQDIWNDDTFVMHPQQPYGRRVARNKNSDTREKWDRSDGEVYIGMLSSTLHEMGIVDLGYERASALDAQTRINPQTFMLTDLGASVLPRVDEEPPILVGETRSLIVQPNFELLIMQPDMPALYGLLPFAQLNQVGVVSRLTLNRMALLRGIEGGKNIEQVIKILEEHSQKELPQNVVYSLNDWARSYKGVTISQVLLLEVSSESVAAELNSPRFQHLHLRQLTPHIFAISIENNLKEVKQLFEKEGISVQISGNILTPNTNRYGFTFDMRR